jgi:hypothetical protein
MRGWKSEIARRPFLAGLFSLLGLGLIGGATYEAAHIFNRRYAPTAFDDLLSLLDDRDSAERVGAAVLAGAPEFDVRKVARELRRKIGGRPLAEILAADVADGRLAEVSGWLLPETLERLCGLAAS